MDQVNSVNRKQPILAAKWLGRPWYSHLGQWLLRVHGEQYPLPNAHVSTQMCTWIAPSPFKLIGSQTQFFPSLIFFLWCYHCSPSIHTRNWESSNFSLDCIKHVPWVIQVSFPLVTVGMSFSTISSARQAEWPLNLRLKESYEPSSKFQMRTVESSTPLNS